MICKECGKSMYLDNRHERFKGNIDKYWLCANCQTSCIEEIRFSQSFREFWHCENNDKAKEYTIKHVIDTSVRIKKGNLWVI